MPIDKKFFTKNRQQLARGLAGEILVLSAYRSMQLTGDESQSFVQEANFWYLTGIEKPDWQIIIDSARDKSWLVMPNMSETTRIFSGGLAAAEARAVSGIEAIIPSTEATSLLKDLAKKHKKVYTLGLDPNSIYYNFVQNPAPALLRAKLKKYFKEIKDARLLLANQRAIKQPVEIEIIQRAIGLTAVAFEDAKRKLSRFSYEYELEAEFTYHFRKNGAKQAFEPIVAGGRNACTLHYTANNDQLRSGSLVVMDIGAQVDRYSADITRTYGFGELTKRQRAVHQAVQQAEKQIVELLRPGLTIHSYLEQVDKIMKQAEMSLDLIDSPNDGAGYRKYFPHSISHGLGADVHEPLGNAKELKPGMVLTVEPGIYIPEENIGTRIEDDILITENGYINLSSELSTSIMI